MPPLRSATPGINSVRKEFNKDADDKNDHEAEKSNCCGDQKNDCRGKGDHVIEEGQPQSIGAPVTKASAAMAIMIVRMRKRMGDIG